jgi:putative peptidoglycan lipid II flippase
LPNLGTIAKAATLVMVFFVVSRLLGIGRDVVIANQFGTSPELEAYLAAFRLPDLVFNVITGGALGSAFIPTYTAFLSQNQQAAAKRLAAAVLNWVLLVTISISLVAAIFAYPLVDNIIVPNFSPAQKLLTAELMRWLLVSTVIFGVSGLLMGILNAHQHFLMPALAPVVYNVAIIIGAGWLGPQWGVYGLVAGVVTGASGHLLVQLPMARRYGFRYQLTLAPRDPGVRQVARLMGPRMLGIAAVQFNFLWDAILASGLTQGSYAGLDYGRRLMLLPQGIIAQAVAAAAFPTFSALAADEDWPALQTAFVGTLRSVLYLTLPATIGLIMLGQPIIALIFERNAFTAESTRLTAWALWFYTLGLVGHSAVEILTRVFYALKNTRTPVFYSLIAMALNIVLSYALLYGFQHFNWPAHGGIALASSLAVSLETVWLIAALKKQPGQLSLRALGQPLGRMGFAGAVMGLSLWAWQATMAGWSVWVVAPGGIALGGAVYVGLTYWLGSEEPVILWNKLRQRIAR